MSPPQLRFKAVDGAGGVAAALRREEPAGPAGGSGGRRSAWVRVRVPDPGVAPRALTELEPGCPVPMECWAPR